MTQETITTITTSADLAALCKRLSTEKFITVDTEFMRERTYYPQLCLVQVAGENEAVIIDAFAKDLNWQPFWDLMKNQNVLKVFHAVRQDIEIFVNLAGIVPQPLFDTQIAAMALGFPDQVSYARLAEIMTGDHINKEEQYTDWTARPLRASQLSYALQDVTILRKVYLAMQAKLDETGRMPWLEEDMDVLNSIDHYRVDPETMWERLKLRSNRPASWAALKYLAAWREREAMRVNRPRQTVLKDDVLVQLAMSVPDTMEKLSKTRGIPNYLTHGEQGETLTGLMMMAKEAKADAVPKRIDGPSMTPAQEDQLELLKMALKIIARQQNVAPKLIANSDDMSDFVQDPSTSVLMTGWRKDLFGGMAEKMIHGKVAISINGLIEI